MGICNCSMFCCTLLYVHSSIAIILMGKRELIALLNLSSWCLVMVERLFLAVPRGCLQFVIVVFPDHTHLLFFTKISCVCRIPHIAIELIRGVNHFHSSLDKPNKLEISSWRCSQLDCKSENSKIEAFFPYIPHFCL